MICRSIDNLNLLLADYLRNHPIKDVSAQQLTITCRQFERWYLDTYQAPFSLASTSEPLVTEYLNWLRAEGRAAKTINRRRGDLLSLWRHAKRRGLLELPDVADVVRFPEPRRLPDAWRQEQLSELLRACQEFQPHRPLAGWDARHDRAIVLVMYDTAYRFTACLELERRQLTPEGSIVALAQSQKTNADEEKWLGADTLLAIRDILRDASPDEPRLFAWPLRKEAFWRRWKKLLALAGLPTTRRDGPQKMRRTSVSWLEAQRPGSARHHLRHQTPGLAEKHYIDPTIVYTYKAPDLMPRIQRAAGPN